MSEKSLWSWGQKRRRSGLETAVEKRGDHHRISVRGRLTIDTSPALLEELRAAAKHASGLKVDLREVTFLDSSGISVLILGRKLAQEKSIDYALLDPSAKVRSIIELSQLHHFFTIETTSDDKASAEKAPEGE